MSFGKNKQKQESKPLTAAQVQTYFDQLNQNTGGRLGSFATTGTRPVAYQALTPDELRALGGAGATRRNEQMQARTRAIEEIEADPSLTIAQKQRARQLTDADVNARLDAIAAETEAIMTDAAARERLRQYESELTSAGLTREDLEALADIFFGGAGNVSRSRGSQFNLGI